MLYKASFSTTAKGVTTLVYIIFAGVIFNDFFGEHDSSLGIDWVWFLLTGLVLVVPYLMHVNNYELNSEGVKINTPLRSKRIRFEDIESVIVCNYDQLGITIRLFGSGGLWGYFGIFYSRQFGRISLNATSLTRTLILLKGKRKKIIISPDNAENFVKGMQDLVPGLASERL
ncbi:MAG TPA: PH domain-containing protein [Flavipsychrobacter sp.]|nr:PH domain-containing protein [Flavipsychrobacter sp.]